MVGWLNYWACWVQTDGRSDGGTLHLTDCDIIGFDMCKVLCS